MNLKNLKYYCREVYKSYQIYRKGQYTISEVIDCARAYYRYMLYGSKLEFLLKEHIIEQYQVRLALMNPQCYNEGSCKMCGCMTTALQFTNASCKKPCYPPMMNKKQWIRFKRMEVGYIDMKKDILWMYTFSPEKPHNKMIKPIFNYSKLNKNVEK